MRGGLSVTIKIMDRPINDLHKSVAYRSSPCARVTGSRQERTFVRSAHIYGRMKRRRGARTLSVRMVTSIGFSSVADVR